MTGIYLAQKAVASSHLNFGRIAKPLRGGGGGPTATGSAPQAISGGGANPLTRLQAEETGGGEWFYFRLITSSYERVADA
jgi:kinesin family member 5